MKKLFFAFLNLWFMMISHQVWAQEFDKSDSKLIHKTVLSLFNNYNTGKYLFKEKKGLVSTPRSGHHNLGFSIMKELYVRGGSSYLSTGARLITSESTIEVRTSLDEFDYRFTFFRYSVRHWQITMPLYLGKTFQFKRDRYQHVDVFAGPSFGMAMACYRKEENQGKKARDDQKFVALSPVGFKDDLGPTNFLAAIDAGFRLAPLSFPNLSVGVTASYNISKVPYMSEKGAFLTEDKTETFSFDFSRRYINLMFQVNYSFGKRWKERVLNKPQ